MVRNEAEREEKTDRVTQWERTDVTLSLTREERTAKRVQRYKGGPRKPGEILPPPVQSVPRIGPAGRLSAAYGPEGPAMAAAAGAAAPRLL